MFYYWEPKELELASGEKVLPLFSGRVKIRAPKHQERLGYLKEITAHKDVQMEQLAKLHEIAKSHIIEVDLKRVEDGYEIKDIELFDYDTDLSNVLMQIANSVLEGTRLGKHLTKN